MQEHQHVKTIPGEPAAPEIVVNPDPDGSTHGEDINIPLVAVSVAFFAAFLAVTIVSLQAWIYNMQSAETAAKQLPQGALGTPLGDQLEGFKHDLTDPAEGKTKWNDHAGYGEALKVERMPIDDAMAETVKAYAIAQNREGPR